MKLTISRIIAAVVIAGAALSLTACETPPPQHVHHYHTRTVVQKEQPRRGFEVVNQYDEQAR